MWTWKPSGDNYVRGPEDGTLILEVVSFKEEITR